MMISSNSLLKRVVPLFTQTAEAHRKPRWVPVAKSKIYRIPKRPVVPPEEKAELKRLTNNYKTQMRAVRRFFYEEMIKEKSSLESASSEMSQKVEAEEWERCVKLNEEWNAAVAAEREQRRAAEVVTMEQHALYHMERKDLKRQAAIAKAAKEIRLQKELSKSFITPETLDEAIEHALANPVDHNFAIDLKGNQFLGRDTPAKPMKEQKATA